MNDAFAMTRDDGWMEWGAGRACWSTKPARNRLSHHGDGASYGGAYGNRFELPAGSISSLTVASGRSPSLHKAMRRPPRNQGRTEAGRQPTQYDMAACEEEDGEKDARMRHAAARKTPTAATATNRTTQRRRTGREHYFRDQLFLGKQRV